jgi:hypothetical protein
MMATDYDALREENIEEYGKGTKHLSFLGSLYADRTHFIFELLQNAEDAGATRILFQLSPDILTVLHDGRPFDERDVRGICGVADGTKEGDLTQIGRFGVGFKSVYAYTDLPSVQSGDESFRIEQYVRPHGEAFAELPPDWTTRFQFPFREKDIAEPEHAPFVEIGKRLSELSPRTLLFLKRITEIEYSITGTDRNEHGQYLRETRILETVRQITIVAEAGENFRSEDWLVFEKPVAETDLPVEMAFLLDNAASRPKLQRLNRSPLSVFFPTEVETRLGFLIQGPYRTTPNRENIPHHDDWNRLCITATAALFRDALLFLRDNHYLDAKSMDAMPIRPVDFPEYGMFWPIAEAYRLAVTVEELLPADGGGFVSSQQAVLARSAALRDLLDADQLTELLGSNYPVRWVSGEITRDRMPDAHEFLTSDEVGVPEIGAIAFGQKLTSDFLAKQTDEWLIRFYDFLTESHGLWKPPRFRDGSGAGILRQTAFLRLQGNEMESPFEKDNKTLKVFLPGNEPSDFPTVKREIYADERAKKFLADLGLKEPDVVEEVIKILLPKYMDTTDASISDEEHLRDFEKIFRALKTDSKDDKERLKNALSEMAVVYAVNSARERELRKPTEVYLATDNLREWFRDEPTGWILAESSGEFPWTEIGVAKTPRFIAKRVSLPEDLRRKLRGRDPKSTMREESTDYQLHGLESVLERIGIADDPMCPATLLWQVLVESRQASRRNWPYDGQHSWFYYSKKFASFESSWQKLVRNTPWLPVENEGDITLRRPGEVPISDLHPRFSEDPEVAAVVGIFSGKEAEVLAQLGLTPSDAKMLQEHPEELSQLIVRLQQQKQEKPFEGRSSTDDSTTAAVDSTPTEIPVFPERSIANSERRSDRILTQLNDSIGKEYETRPRSVRTTYDVDETRTWLRNQYTNDDGVLVCQLCHHAMPFRKRNGEYYFEAVEAFPESVIAQEFPAAHLALCPVCAAKYREFVRDDTDAVKNLVVELSQPMNVTESTVVLGSESAVLRFVETHAHDLRHALDKQNHAREGNEA